jgi:hypothetical protein
MSLASLFSTGKQRVVDLINKDNDLSLQANAIELGVPINTPAGTRNTQIKLTMDRPDGTGSGSIDIHYNRLDITQELSLLTDGDTTVMLDVFPYTGLHQLIDVINIETGLGLSQSDVNDIIFDKSETTFIVNVPMRADSLVYTGTLVIHAVNVDWSTVRGVMGGDVRVTTEGNLRGISQ